MTSPESASTGSHRTFNCLSAALASSARRVHFLVPRLWFCVGRRRFRGIPLFPVLLADFVEIVLRGMTLAKQSPGSEIDLTSLPATCQSPRLGVAKNTIESGCEIRFGQEFQHSVDGFDQGALFGIMRAKDGTIIEVSEWNSREAIEKRTGTRASSRCWINSSRSAIACR